MRFLLDENLPRDLAVALRAAGHDVERAQDVGLLSKPDPDVLRFATSANRVLVTNDVGLANIVTYPLRTHRGIVLTRVPVSVPRALRVARLLEVIATLDPDDVAGGALVVVDETTVRVRRAFDG